MLASIKEDDNIIKNFGYTKFADMDDHEDTEFEEREPGIFEGDITKENEEYKARLLDHFYGNWIPFITTTHNLSISILIFLIKLYNLIKYLIVKV